jgi:hypothetical protein
MYNTIVKGILTMKNVGEVEYLIDVDGATVQMVPRRIVALVVAPSSQ